eukprot:CAMPEP_0179842376 /NCGR_PEP_ID=MMETSP0982-20121206/3090_1 /TAXON_ID=483367 /ORGANISM="non described non described, Strain CCMP 2436" /LENGTH=95 /DNA_ID=CAMNT_0021726637 /DNA_START=41 /DNA_END=328 /DNA_ORIENTATION=-
MTGDHRSGAGGIRNRLGFDPTLSPPCLPSAPKLIRRLGLAHADAVPVAPRLGHPIQHFVLQAPIVPLRPKGVPEAERVRRDGRRVIKIGQRAPQV